MKTNQPALVAGLDDKTLTTVVTVFMNVERQLGRSQEPADLMGAVVANLRRA